MLVCGWLHVTGCVWWVVCGGLCVVGRVCVCGGLCLGFFCDWLCVAGWDWLFGVAYVHFGCGNTSAVMRLFPTPDSDGIGFVSYNPGDVAVVHYANDADGGVMVQRLLDRLGIAADRILHITAMDGASKRLPAVVTACDLVCRVARTGVAMDDVR